MATVGSSSALSARTTIKGWSARRAALLLLLLAALAMHGESAYVVSTLAGSTTNGFIDGTGTAARFSGALGAAIDPVSGLLVVSDYSNNALRTVTLPGGVVVTLAGQQASGCADATGAAAQFSGPSGLVADGAGNVVVTDALSAFLRNVSVPSGVVATWSNPSSCSSGSNMGTQLGSSGTAAIATSLFNMPLAMAMDAAGALYFSDLGTSCCPSGTPALLKVVNGIMSTVAYNLVGRAAGIAVDPASGTVYVSLSNRNQIVAIAPSGAGYGAPTVLAGSTSFSSGNTDGTGSNARFNSPLGLAMDSNGNLYVGASAVRFVISARVHALKADAHRAPTASQRTTRTTPFDR